MIVISAGRSSVVNWLASYSAHAARVPIPPTAVPDVGSVAMHSAKVRGVAVSRRLASRMSRAATATVGDRKTYLRHEAPLYDIFSTS